MPAEPDRPTTAPTAADHAADLEADDVDQDDTDSAYGDETSSTTSVASEIMRYHYENGHRYHSYKPGHYAHPNDEAELDRLDLQHHIITLLLDGKLYTAPLRTPQKVLDLGTGTGLWAIEFADLHPEAEVIGTDLAPTQPQWVPPNLQFEIDDFESDWTFPPNTFDYIHSRFLIGGVSDWKQHIRNAYKHTRPGGYFEIQELDPRFYCDDGTLPADAVQTQWVRLMCEASDIYNRPTPLYHEYKAWLEEAGFEDVHEVIYKLPQSPWPKDRALKQVAMFQLSSYVDGLEGISVGLFTRVLHWSVEELQVLLARMRTELKDRRIHSYQRIAVLCGRKPLKSQTPAEP